MDGSTPYCTIFILVVTGLVSYQGFRDPVFRARYLFDPAAILRDKQYGRLLTSGFLHLDWAHLFFNAFSFYSFGRWIEIRYGVPTLLVIYLGSIVGGNLLSLVVHRHHVYRALGASGGVCGVIFASIFLLPGGGIMIFPVPYPIPSWLYAVLFIVGSFVAMRRRIGNIGHDAHLGGAIVGLLITTVLHPSIVSRSPVLYLALMGLSTAILVTLWVNPQFTPRRSRPTPRPTGFPAPPGRPREAAGPGNDAELDRLLEKVSASGLHTLTPEERSRLIELAERRRRDDG